MEDRFIITLASGIEVECEYLTGKARNVFFNQQYINDGTVIPRLLKQIVKRVGNETNIRFNVSPKDKDQSGFDVLDFLAPDANQILCEARLQDIDKTQPYQFEQEFAGYALDEATEEYTEVVRRFPVRIPIHDIKVKPTKVPVYVEGNPMKGIAQWIVFSEHPTEEAEAATNVEYKQVSEYKELLGYCKSVPCVSKDKVFSIDLLTLRHSHIAMLKRMKESMTSTLLMRNLAYNHVGMSSDAIENMRDAHIGNIQAFVKDCEGDYDMRLVLDNPFYCESKPFDTKKNSPKVITSLLALPDFLFKGVAS